MERLSLKFIGSYLLYLAKRYLLFTVFFLIAIFMAYGLTWMFFPPGLDLKADMNSAPKSVIYFYDILVIILFTFCLPGLDQPGNVGRK